MGFSPMGLNTYSNIKLTAHCIYYVVGYCRYSRIMLTNMYKSKYKRVHPETFRLLDEDLYFSPAETT
jgi:hypothetical protein